MTLSKIDPTETSAWQALQSHHDEISAVSLAKLFEKNPDRATQFSVSLDGLFLDYSKNFLTQETLALLYDLARACKIEANRNAMFCGYQINETEGRAVLHTALRNGRDETLAVDGRDILNAVRRELDRMEDFVDRVHSGEWKGYSGKTIENVVNIGIGGSDLGVMMAYEALTPYHHEGINVHFVSNIDGSHLDDTLRRLDPETTLFIIASKTFTTIETMTNARSARKWFLKSGAQQDIASHFAAVSTNSESVAAFGIDPANMFTFWDWVGGRFSLSSAIGLSVMLGIGASNFRQLLGGMEKMDTHFASAPIESNVPVILALISIWYGNFFGSETEVVLPYDQHLQHFPAYLQQTSMESNGKSTDRYGRNLKYQTGPVIWGGAGTNTQHSFFQLLHQGTQLIPADFILCAKAHHDYPEHQLILAANCFAQSEALMIGRNEDEVRAELADLSTEEIERILPFKVFAGNRPSNTLVLDQLNPENLGLLISLYEHKTFVQGVIWNIYSFDQYGVELGKVLAKKILPELSSDQENHHDGSTRQLIRHFLNRQS